ncbi:hypothetical protein EBU71_05825 [bacterium]|nr:hypothetical protein [Candidatus Elulimicrobium humile]
MHCDKHVVKMIIEYAQLLSTAHRVLDGTSNNVLTKSKRKYTTWIHPTPLMESTLYKSTMKNHPSAIWVRESITHYEYLKELWKHLSDEYTHRYGKTHSTYNKLKDVLKINPINIPNLPFKDPPPAMSHFPDCIVPNNSLYSYYNYYIVAKNYFAKWTNRPIPVWYSEGLSTKKLYA